MTSVLPIRLVRPPELQVAAEHMARHSEESGRGGDPIFAPFEEFDSESWRKRCAESFRLAVDQPGWERLWGAFDDGRMVGHVALSGPSLEASLHRARLGVGVERAHRGRGLGRSVIQTAIRWATDEPSLSWIDLGVFAHNAKARALYIALGFHEIALMTDLFRVHGHSIDDVTMALRLR